MEEVQPVIKLAARRPDWQLPELHSGLELAPLDSLYDNKERIPCPKCGRRRAHYCYDCLQALVPFPHVPLPFRVSIVTHHEEKASKNTGVQVAILAEGQVDLHSMTNVPADVDPCRCAVLFPSDTALEVEQLEPDSIDRLFIIDSRWKKAGELVRTDTFRSMRAVKLSQTRSAFWRFHTRGVAEEGVCTVEALYFCLDAMAKKGKLTDPRFTAPHAFDNLLWYFVYQHQVVQQAAQKRLQQQGAAGDQQPRQQPQKKGQQRKQQQEQQQPNQKQQKKKGQQRQAQEQEGVGELAGGEDAGVPVVEPNAAGAGAAADDDDGDEAAPEGSGEATREARQHLEQHREWEQKQGQGQGQHQPTDGCTASVAQVASGMVSSEQAGELADGSAVGGGGAQGGAQEGLTASTASAALDAAEGEAVGDGVAGGEGGGRGGGGGEEESPTIGRKEAKRARV